MSVIPISTCIFPLEWVATLFNKNTDCIIRRTENVSHWLETKCQQKILSFWVLFLFQGVGGGGGSVSLGRVNWHLRLWVFVWKLEMILFVWYWCHCGYNVIANPNRVLTNLSKLGKGPSAQSVCSRHFYLELSPSCLWLSHHMMR